MRRLIRTLDAVETNDGKQKPEIVSRLCQMFPEQTLENLKTIVTI